MSYVEGHHLNHQERVFAIDLGDFDEKVIQASNKNPVLVDFWADWCGPCLVIAPHIERAVCEYPQPIQLAKLEVDEGENMKLAGKYLVRGFPTIILFDNGEEKGRFSSARTAPWITQWLDEKLN